MKKRYFSTVILLTGIILFGAGNVMAQKDSTKLKQEVEVTKAYQPEIQEAVKINDIPKVVAEPTETPTFDYSIFSKPIFSTIEVTPVAAAKMVGEPKPEMGMGLLNLGIGNYLTPYGEFFFNSKPDKNSNFGIHFRHLSSSGKVKLLNDDKVSAPESNNSAEIFGQKFFRKSSLTGSLAYDRKAFTYYGYTGNPLNDDLKTLMIPYFGDRQYFSKGTASVRLKSESLSKYDFNYDFGINYHYLISKTGQTERQTVFSGEMSKKIDSALGRLATSLTYYRDDSIWNRNFLAYGHRQQILVNINPSFEWSGENAKLEVGLNTTAVFDKGANSFLVWPKVKAEWSPVAQVLTLYAGVDGHLQHNTWSAIAEENPYVDPYHDVANANYKTVFSGGFKGKIGSKTNFVADASYSEVKGQHFYYISGFEAFNATVTNRRLENTFSWLYDDVNILKLSGEVMHTVSDNFSLHLLGNYYSYNLKTQPYAWQMPNFELTFSGVFKPTEQLKFTTDLIVIGSRKALIQNSHQNDPLTGAKVNPTEMQISMDPIIDLNAGVEYQFSKSLSLFGKLHNFGFQKYEQWLGYTSKGLNWLAGISYSF